MVNMNRIQKSWWVAFVCLLTFNVQAQLTPVNKGGKYGFQRNGTMVITPQYDYASHFTEGMALVKSGRCWGYIDTAGNWLIQPVYTHATPLQKGFAYVFNNGKRGVIGRGGKVILEAVHDSIVNQRYFHIVVKGKLRGFANENFSFVTPVIYTEIDNYYYNYFCCKKPSGSWDIYSENELVIADVDRPLGRHNFLTNTKVMFLKKNGKYGVWQVGEGWKHEPDYDSIISTPYPYYTVGNNYFREVFLLWNKGADPDPASRRHQSFQVMDGGGTILSKETYYDFENPLSNEFPLKFQSDEVTMFLYPELKAVHLPYGNVRQHLDWYIASANGKDRILDKEFRELAVFDQVEPVMVTEPMEYYDETDGMFYNYKMYPDQTPYLVVSTATSNQFKHALYALIDQKIVTPFYDSVVFRSVYDHISNQTGYIYSLENGTEGIFLPGMKTGTVPKFMQISLLGERKMTCTNPENGLGQLWDLSVKEPKLMLEEYSIEPSSGVFTNYVYFDSISGEVNYMDPVPAFSQSFFLCKNEAGKIGVLCLNGERTPCIYDEVSQNERVSNLLDVQINGRYGILNLKNGETITPYSDHPLEPDYNPYRQSWYTTEYESSESGEFVSGYYLDQHGKYFIQSLYDHSRFVKTGGMVGLMAYSEFDETEIQVIPAAYKKLEFMLIEYDCNILKAKGKNGKWGVLDFKGDTLIPFLFDAIETNYFSDGETAYIQCKKGKKWALYNQNGVCLIPLGAADTWRELTQSDGYACLISYQSGIHYGAVAYNGKHILPPLFDEVNLYIPFGADQYGRDRVVQLKQDGKWWAVNARLANSYHQIYTEVSATPIELELDTTTKWGPYDFIIGDWYFRENKPGDFTIDRITLVRETVQQNGPMPDMTEGAVRLFTENGKIGVRLLEDEGKEKTVLSPTFTNVSFYDDATILVHDKGQSFYYNFITKKRFNIESW